MRIVISSYLFLALGGYSTENGSKDYKTATGVVITYLINNYNAAALLEPALEWELEYD